MATVCVKGLTPLPSQLTHSTPSFSTPAFSAPRQQLLAARARERESSFLTTHQHIIGYTVSFACTASLQIPVALIAASPLLTLSLTSL